MTKSTSTLNALQHSNLPLSGRIVMFFIRHIQQALASIGEIWRTPVSSLMTMIVLGVSLSLPAALQVLVKNAAVITNSWDNAAQISLFIDSPRSEASIQSLLTRIKSDPDVSEVLYISRKQALDEFQALSGFGDALAYLDENPLPAVISVTPTNQASSPVKAKALLKRLEQEPQISLGRLDIEWLQKLQAIVSIIQRTVFAVALLLILAVTLVIGNTIRLSIMNRQREIEVMKLVGATDAFIQRPFVYSGIWLGIIAGGIAVILVQSLVWYLDGALVGLLQLYDSPMSLSMLSLDECGLLVLFAAFLGWLGAYLSVRQHLKAIEPR
ncbi:cell division protein FtsX [Parashewanella curva]|uniref:Cell division protein FtsX n=1 Tax=Parashewanella curva TaxID=2338552 RepID=A0A3L8PT33_9GAMM|nr:permease-like cell division protein FtsX [Parashewanella curva]RLV57743.1 cell division protein FtsX [Parashewanella curva]